MGLVLTSRKVTWPPLKCMCSIGLNKLCAIEIAAEIEITTAHTSSKMRAEKGRTIFRHNLLPLASGTWSISFSSVGCQSIAYTLYILCSLVVLDLVSGNLPTPTSTTISLVQLQIPSVWLSEDFTMGLNSSLTLSSLYIYSWYTMYLWSSFQPGIPTRSVRKKGVVVAFVGMA